MSSETSNQRPSQGMGGMWPYLATPFAAAVAAYPIYADMATKSALQTGAAAPSFTTQEARRGGFKLMPTVGGIVGAQLLLQKIVEKALKGDGKKEGLALTVTSSAIVGAASSPFLAVFNGQTMGWGVRQSLRKFTFKQACVITVQEGTCVTGLTAASYVATALKRKFGDHKAIDYGAAFLAGGLGSWAGHPANTALTRWQSGLKMDGVHPPSDGKLFYDKIRQLLLRHVQKERLRKAIDVALQSMWGAGHKACGVGKLAVGMTLVKEWFSSPPAGS